MTSSIQHGGERRLGAAGATSAARRHPEDGGRERSDRIDGAVPMLCEAGDTIVTNRQLVHGSFATARRPAASRSTPDFFPRKRVLNITTRR